MSSFSQKCEAVMEESNFCPSATAEGNRQFIVSFPFREYTSPRCGDTFTCEPRGQLFRRVSCMVQIFE